MILIENKNVNLNYFIIKSYNAGLILKGWEVRSIKKYKNIYINKAIIIIKNINEMFFKNIYIKNMLNKNYDKLREIKILLNKEELYDIFNILYKNNYKIIPLNLFLKNNIIKSKISIVLKKKNKIKFKFN